MFIYMLYVNIILYLFINMVDEQSKISAPYCDRTGL